jgi:hypothetical protein
MENPNYCGKEVGNTINNYYGNCCCDVVPSINENGNWFIGGIDTGIKAQGDQGELGATGPMGPQGVRGEAGPEADMTVFYPHLWKEGMEYDFGNGLYGQRFTGTITENAHTKINTLFMEVDVNVRICSCEGWWADGLSITVFGSVYGDIDTDSCAGIYIALQGETTMKKLYFRTYSIARRVDSPYDIRITYTK